PLEPMRFAIRVAGAARPLRLAHRVPERRFRRIRIPPRHRSGRAKNPGQRRPSLPPGAEGKNRGAMAVKPTHPHSGEYTDQKLGHGSTGEVWLAREKDTHLLVSIKLLRTELFPPSSAQPMYERLVSSITHAGRLTHPNLSQTRATFHQPRLGLYGIVSEYL